MRTMTEVDPFVLSELAAVLRAIARERRGAGTVLRSMANAYEARAKGRADTRR